MSTLPLAMGGLKSFLQSVKGTPVLPLLVVMQNGRFLTFAHQISPHLDQLRIWGLLPIIPLVISSHLHPEEARILSCAVCM